MIPCECTLHAPQGGSRWSAARLARDTGDVADVLNVCVRAEMMMLHPTCLVVPEAQIL